jgi:hypothetical protein
VGAWSADQVAEWLRTQELTAEVLHNFEGTTGSDLVLLTGDDMVNGGMRKMKAAALVKKIKALQ